MNAKDSQQNDENDCQVNFERIATEIDVLIQIFQLLEFRDQMHLARVNCLLQDVFRTFIWKDSYCVMKIVENSNGNFLIQNGVGANWLYLEYEEFQEFLQIFGNDAKELHVSQGYVHFVRMPKKCADSLDLQGDIPADEEITCEVGNRNKKEGSLSSWCVMRNLSYLSLGGGYINRKNFDFMVKHLADLESLELKMDIENDVEGYQDTYNYGKSLLQMQKLKRFTLAVSSPVALTINYRIYRDLITLLDLEYLRVDMSLQHQEKFMHRHEMAQKPLRIRHLDISLTSDNYNSIETIMSACFLNCENLLQLQLQLPELTLSQEALTILLCQCKNLEILELKRTNINCEEIEMPECIKAVTLTQCRGLTCDNLKQILKIKSLEKFVSSKTPFSGQLLNVYISESLQILECDCVATPYLMAHTSALNNLTHLIWYDPLGESAADAATCLFACPQIERLHIASDPIPLKALLPLSNLRVLSLHHVYALNWSYIVDLLNQLTLHELKISQFCGAEAVDTPARGFATTVKLLHVNMNMIVQADFWLDLFRKNPDLTLIFFGQIGPFHLKRIFHKARFPNDLRTIEFSGINIKCVDLRRNFDETIGKTPFLKNYKSENYIKLCRKNVSEM